MKVTTWVVFALAAALTVMTAGCGQSPTSVVSPAPSTAQTVIQNAQAEAAPAPITLPLRIAADLTVRNVRFGLLKTQRSGEDQFVATQEIPPFDGQAFGWIIEVETSRHSLHWQEHLRMPAPPADWGDAATDADLVISKDGKSAVAQGEDAVEDRELSRFYWSLATGDPAGEYQMDVAIEGHPVAHVRFNVAAPVKEETLLVHRRWSAPAVRLLRVALQPRTLPETRRLRTSIQWN